VVEKKPRNCHKITSIISEKKRNKHALRNVKLLRRSAIYTRLAALSCCDSVASPALPAGSRCVRLPRERAKRRDWRRRKKSETCGMDRGWRFYRRNAFARQGKNVGVVSLPFELSARVLRNTSSCLFMGWRMWTQEPRTSLRVGPSSVNLSILSHRGVATTPIVFETMAHTYAMNPNRGETSNRERD
jgi:hypothetical protein